MGGQLVSAYYGSGEPAEHIAKAEAFFCLARHLDRALVHLASQELITRDAANEAQYNEVESRLIDVLAAAGYHRRNRGPWRKARAATPNAERQTPNCAFNLLLPLEPELLNRVTKCREHCAAIAAAYESASVRSASFLRLYQRTATRALRRLTAAEASLDILHTLAVRTN